MADKLSVPRRPPILIIFFNFGKDRPRQTVTALFKPDFDRDDLRAAEVT
jgi:bisphosphoglycerate-independent phosphoglycerate mutase (AlkP superfamily)